MPRHFSTTALLAAALLAGSAASADTLRILTAGAFKEVVVGLAPGFEARTGHRLDIRNETAGALLQQIRAGAEFDAVFLTPAALRSLETEGAVLAGSTRTLAQVGIGVAVPAGAAKPAMASTGDFKAVLLAARRVAYIDPASGGSSGIYLDGLFRRMDIASAIAPKAVLVPGGLVATRLVDGQADLAIHQMSELRAVPGITIVGPLPDAIQNYTVYAGAVGSRSPRAEAARAFLADFSTDRAREQIEHAGMEPAPR